MNAIVDALSVYGIRHIDMPASRRGCGSDPGGEAIKGSVFNPGTVSPARDGHRTSSANHGSSGAEPS